MALKTTLFFALFLVATVIWAFILDTTNTQSQINKDIPAIEFEDFEVYNITKDGVTQSMFADRGLHYSNKDILYNGFVYRGITGEIEGISGDVITQTPNLLTVEGDGKYLSTKGYELHSEKIIYDMLARTVVTVGDFKAFHDIDTLTGTDMFLDLETKVLKAKTIHAIISTQTLQN